MADAAPAPSGGDSRGRGRGGFGRPGDRRDKKPTRTGASARAGGGPEEGEWVPTTKLGRLVKAGLVTSLETIYLNSYQIKEHQIVDYIMGGSGTEGSKLKDEVFAIQSVQRQSAAGQRTRFKCYVVVGDGEGHIGLGTKTASEVATAIRGAIWAAKVNLRPVRRGYWGLMAGEPHTVTTKVTGAAGSVRVRIIPAPRGTGLVAAPVPKKILAMAGLQDAYTSTRGHSKTQGNFVRAVIAALHHTYTYLTPDLWPERKLEATPYEKNSDYLASKTKAPIRR